MREPLTLCRQGSRFVDATPFASSLIEGHRDFGYDLKTAIADVIDNSISATANHIHLRIDTVSETPSLAIADNGVGMTEAELIEAMRLGSKNPFLERSQNDLGRFGLGLKSASFSQCRTLTVFSRKDGITSCARWDLDHVAKNNAWQLEVVKPKDNMLGLDLLPESGTVVLWTKLDRLFGGEINSKSRASVNSELAGVEYHLRQVFHRFLERSNNKVEIYFNNRLLTSLDPTASKHPATQKDPEDTILLNNGLVKVRSFTLPHYKKTSQKEWDELGGPEGYLKSQGLYIYRQERLIISGGWLGLIKQTELTKLSRIAIEIPNSMDSDWKIDVKKSSAQLPNLVRERLLKVIERYVGTSKRTYRARAEKLVNAESYPLWERFHKNGHVTFKPSFEHPVIKMYLSTLPEELKPGFERCIRLIGAGLPIDALHAALLGNAECVVPQVTEEEDLEKLIYDLANTLINVGVETSNLKDVLNSYPIIQSNWNKSEKMIDYYLKEMNRE